MFERLYADQIQYYRNAYQVQNRITPTDGVENIEGLDAYYAFEYQYNGNINQVCYYENGYLEKKYGFSANRIITVEEYHQNTHLSTIHYSDTGELQKKEFFILPLHEEPLNIWQTHNETHKMDLFEHQDKIHLLNRNLVSTYYNHPTSFSKVFLYNNNHIQEAQVLNNTNEVIYTASYTYTDQRIAKIHYRIEGEPAGYAVLDYTANQDQPNYSFYSNSDMLLGKSYQYQGQFKYDVYKEGQVIARLLYDSVHITKAYIYPCTLESQEEDGLVIEEYWELSFNEENKISDEVLFLNEEPILHNVLRYNSRGILSEIRYFQNEVLISKKAFNYPTNIFYPDNAYVFNERNVVTHRYNFLRETNTIETNCYKRNNRLQFKIFFNEEALVQVEYYNYNQEDQIDTIAYLNDIGMLINITGYVYNSNSHLAAINYYDGSLNIERSERFMDTGKMIIHYENNDPVCIEEYNGTGELNHQDYFDEHQRIIKSIAYDRSGNMEYYYQIEYSSGGIPDQQIFYDPEGRVIKTYQYNDDGNVVRINTFNDNETLSQYRIMHYNGDQLFKEEFYNTQNRLLYVKIYQEDDICKIIHYNSNNTIKSIEYYADNSKFKEEWFTYNDQGKLITIEEYDENLRLIQTSRFFYSNASNSIRQEIYNPYGILINSITRTSLEY